MENFIKTLAGIAILWMFIACGEGGSELTGPSSLGNSGGFSTDSTVTASGNTVTQSRSVTEFDSLTIGVPGRLTIEHGAGASLTITGDERVLSVITSEVANGELVLAQSPNTDLRLEDPLEIEYRVTIETLRRLSVNGTVHAVATGIGASPFEVNINGASTVVASGSTNRQIVNLFGSSRYEARDLESRDVELNVTGTAFAVLNVSDTLSGHVTGAAIVRYLGAPDVSVAVTGAASVGPE